MNISAIPYQSTLSREANRVLSATIGLLVLFGFFVVGSVDQMLGYLIVVLAAVLPGVLWVRMGAPGIPVLPVAAFAYIPYFAFPIATSIESSLSYTSWEITLAALTVALFLVTTTIAWYLIANRVRQGDTLAEDSSQHSQIVRVIFVGLVIGVIFHLGALSGILGEMVGTYYGVVRSISLTLVVVTCFLIGVARAQGFLRGNAWGASLAGLALLVLLSWSSLLLVGGMIFVLAGVLGYVVVTRRVPWIGIGLVLIAVTILHAGKAEMRNKYWESSSAPAFSVLRLPGFAAEWIGEGIDALASGGTGQNVLDRASLLQMLLLVESETPERLDFLFGETYSMLPAILVPRFIESDKPASQVGMDLLNVRYGLLTVEGAASTAIGWGLVAEAYANFGFLGVIGIALLVGACCGALAIWGQHAAIISLPTLGSIAVMMGLVSLELDFIQLASSLLQSFASLLIFLAIFRWYAPSQRNRPVSTTRSF